MAGERGGLGINGDSWALLGMNGGFFWWYKIINVYLMEYILMDNLGKL